MTAPPSVAEIQAQMAPLLPGLLGVELIEATRDHVVATLRVRPDLCSSRRTIHGGTVMAFADTLGAIGTILNLPPNARTTTIESSTKFLKAAAEGSVVRGESRPLHIGRTTMVWQTELRNEEGKLCAVVTQTQLVIAE
jgi:1,4-dihydroxy-2-naphthoyl-CoA hydrolase